ncbi:MAG TPA: glycosyltransferase family 4 protein [Acidimicrobiales bacterium]|nr:glycosyltransferase family 4 protein [Acidimicrobiales bacterium]
MKHLLVTNDFPPKVGGIQIYLWELWRRLPAGAAAVVTTAHPDAAAFDAEQSFEVTRAGKVLLPTPRLARLIRERAAACGAELVVLDPALPLGLLGPQLGVPYAVVVHGAEITLPARIPGAAQALRRVLRGASLILAAGEYVATEAAAVAPSVKVVSIPPGVDPARFTVPSPDERIRARARWGMQHDDEVVLHVSRLVPRKGADVLIKAAAAVGRRRPNLLVMVAGSGRDERRLRRLAAKLDSPVRFLGRIPELDKPGLYGASDVFSHVCRNRWFGLEQEGFGIIFLEAAACGVSAIAGASGGTREAVLHGETGLVIDPPTDVAGVATALDLLLSNRARAQAFGAAGRERTVAQFGYDVLAARLETALS